MCSPVSVRYPTLVQALQSAPAEKKFVTMCDGEEGRRSVTFGEFLGWAKAQASLFHENGALAGDRIVLVMPQGIELMAAFVGAMLLGAVPAILAYPNFKVEPRKYRTGLAGVSANLRARLIVVDNAFPDELLECLELQGRAQLIRSLEASAPSGKLHDGKLLPQDLAFIQHSAGTTGLQKGVALSHAAVLRQLAHLSETLHIEGDDRIYSWLPLYHDMGLIACFMLPMVCHLEVVMQSPTEWVMQPSTMLRLITDSKCTLAWLPNFAFQFLARRVREQDREDIDLSSMRMFINCSEPVRSESVDEFLRAYEAHGVRPEALQSCYAMAETVFAVTQSGQASACGPVRIWVRRQDLISRHQAVLTDPGSQDSICLVSSGRCMAGSEVRIVGEGGSTLGEGLIGEIFIRSDSLSDGYFNRDDLTAAAFCDGWYRSGDLGFLLKEELFVLGRKKDLIIVAGKNIYPNDVETIACNHPAIHDGRAVAMGLYNPDLGTQDIIVVAEVEDKVAPERAAAIEGEIRSAIVAELGVAVRAVYLKPSRWIVKSTAGKPARSATRAKLLAEHPELKDESALQLGDADGAAAP